MLAEIIAQKPSDPDKILVDGIYAASALQHDVTRQREVLAKIIVDLMSIIPITPQNFSRIMADVAIVNRAIDNTNTIIYGDGKLATPPSPLKPNQSSPDRTPK